MVFIVVHDFIGFKKYFKVKMDIIMQQMVHHKWEHYKVKFKLARSLSFYIKINMFGYQWKLTYLVYAIRFLIFAQGLGKRKKTCPNLFTILNKFMKISGNRLAKIKCPWVVQCSLYSL